MTDPARAALDHVLLLTLEHGRFPREERARQRFNGPPGVLDRLLSDRRYLARVITTGPDGHHPVRLAVTLAGIDCAAVDERLSEQQGLADTRARLVQAVDQNLFSNGTVKLEALHAQCHSGAALIDFRRWCTLLCSPRLQGRYVGDPVGFCGWVDAGGYVDGKTGFFTELFVRPSFTTWIDSPAATPPPGVLLSEEGLRVEVDKHGHVRAHLGMAPLVLGVPPDSMPARVLAALVAKAGHRLHALDLQAHGDGRTTVGSGQSYSPRSATARLRALGIVVELDSWPRDDIRRLAAVLRRIDLFESLADQDGLLPKFARNPRADKRAAVGMLKSTLATGSIRPGFTLIKNATRSVTRGLSELLEQGDIVQFRESFKLGEWLVYEPPR